MDSPETFLGEIQKSLLGYHQNLINVLQQHDAATDEKQITSSSINFYLINQKFFQELGSDFNKSTLAGEYYLNQALQFQQSLQLHEISRA